MAKNNEVPIMILAQLNKEAESETPRKSQIMHSDAISHNSDIVLLISQAKEQKQRNEFDIIIDKNRDGREEVITFSHAAWLMTELSEAEQKSKEEKPKVLTKKTSNKHDASLLRANDGDEKEYARRPLHQTKFKNKTTDEKI